MGISIRKVSPADCRFLYECRNDEEARRNARNTGEISYSEHEAWFKKIIGNDSETDTYIGEDGSEKLGVVRFIYGDPAEIAIHMHPDKRRRGYGTILLQKAIKDFVKEHLEEKVLMATIRPSNIGSIRIFEKIGFKATGEKDPKDSGFDVYVLYLEGGK